MEDSHLKKILGAEGDLAELAGEEADYRPIPPAHFSKIAYPLVVYWNSHAPILGRLVGYLVMSPVTIINSILESTWLILETSSSVETKKKGDHSSHHVDIYQDKILTLIPNLVKNFTILTGYAYAINTFYQAKFQTRKIPALAVSSVAYGALYYVCRYHFKLTTPKAIDEKELFKNVNDQVRAGLIQKGSGRIEAMEALSKSLVRLPGLDVNIPFITGPSGVGKTKFIKDLAWLCVNDDTFSHYGKTVFSINTATLLENPKLLGKILKAIQDQQNNVILFFDEAHNGGESKHAQKHGGPGGTKLLEILKTDILDNNILCVMATTTEEYKTFIEPNTAFVSRTVPIELAEPNEEETKDLLKEYVQNNLSSRVEVTQDGYSKIVTVAAKHPDYANRHNPRRSFQVLQSVVSKAQIWNPTQLRIDLQKEEKKERGLRMECLEEGNNPTWSFSVEGKGKSKELRTSQAKIKELKLKIEERTRDYKKIRQIQDLFFEYRAQLASLVHQIAKGTSSEAEKRFFYTKFVTLPALQRLLKDKVNTFNQDSKEKISLTIDAEFVTSQTAFAHSL